MSHFSRAIDLPVSIERAFAYHERAMALARMLPPWEAMQYKTSSLGIHSGNRVALQMSRFGIPLAIEAEHELYEPPELFSDRMLRGPFASWLHLHRFQSVGGGSRLIDEVDYRLPSSIGWIPGIPSWVQKHLETMFAYRHHVLLGDMHFANFLESESDRVPKRIAITGTNGLIGQRIVSLLSVLGHDVVRIVRKSSSVCYDGKQETLWDPKAGLREPSLLDGVDAVIHLAGENIAGRWTNRKKEELLQSRENATRILVHQLAELPNPPKAFVAASGIGIYGDRGDRFVTEKEGVGSGFLGELAQRWEDASASIESNGVRRCIGRLGIVLHPRLGALSKMLPLFRYGLGGRLGNGKQYWSWVELDDAASAMVWMAISNRAHGAYNLCSPQTVANSSFTRALGHVLHRTTCLPVPAWALRTAMGQMADELLLTSCRAIPNRLMESGFPFRGLDLRSVLKLWCGCGD